MEERNIPVLNCNLVSPLVICLYYQHLGADPDILATTCQVIIKFLVDIHGPQRVCGSYVTFPL